MSLHDKFVESPYNKKDLKKFSVKDEDDLKYMNSVSAAILMQTKMKTRIILWLAAIIVIWLIGWAYYAKIDALTRGQGKIIPSQQLQIVQNLEGGVVNEILVKEGENVKKGQILLKIDDTDFKSKYMENQLRYNELWAKSIRLIAESSGKPFQINKKLSKIAPELFKHERSLYLTNKEQLNNNIRIYQRRLSQKRTERKEAEAKLRQLKSNYVLLAKEIQINKPLVKKGIVSEVEFLQLQRKAGSLHGEVEAIKLSIPRLISIIEEQKNNIKEVKLKFKNAAKENYNKTKAEMERISKMNIAQEYKVKRSFIRSPVNGTINQILVNTIGGVVKPGMDLVKIVPSQDNLIVEAKIRPSDIAFLYPGQKAIIKFSAYDFAIYGALNGVLTHISADTIVDKIDKKSYYLVKIKTNKNYLGTKDNKLKLIAGMTADVDIITGKKTVLDYILKPIRRAFINTLSER
ncbi:HlyD family type I secretion periplasmic adaptor subunit [Sulfurimonas sp.]|uniref:HlyD family type I secretion periplasmic adaptor subunit n=1 Tax=Sulfurimonas sp. TaxID=2022749 RepID=UPI002616FE7B|nr:HlyD family type I secretion periplasmic adaptor subunit [Sulfurimonas sp.]